MRKVKWSSSANEATSAEDVVAVSSNRVKKQDVWKGFAAFLLGMTLGVSAIIFGQTAISDAPGADPASVWNGQPQLRH